MKISRLNALAYITHRFYDISTSLTHVNWYTKVTLKSVPCMRTDSYIVSAIVSDGDVSCSEGRPPLKFNNAVNKCAPAAEGDTGKHADFGYGCRTTPSPGRPWVQCPDASA